MGRNNKYDAFICHASEDKNEIARPLADVLVRTGLHVWYDEFSLTVGDSLRRAIERGLSESMYGVVILSPVFFQKEWPQKELDGLAVKEDQGGKVILPVWHNIQRDGIAKYSPMLADRIGTLTSRGLDQVVMELYKAITQGKNVPVIARGINYTSDQQLQRGRMAVGGQSIALPCFFPSISSIRTNLSPLKYLQFLMGAGHGLFLISAYDIFHAKKDKQRQIREKLMEAHGKGTIILLDSGYYESTWNEDETWNVTAFRQTTKTLSCNLAFCFDKSLDRKDKEKGDSAMLINQTEAAVLKDQQCCPGGSIVPIIHASTDKLPDICTGIAQRLNPVMLAVPERELGDGVLARSITIAKIRNALNRTGQYYHLHILGTGNPRSIALFAYCGADSFDGLEWCKTAVDHNTGLLYHFHQRDMFGDQSVFCGDIDIPYIQATLGHNLVYYTKFMELLQKASAASEMDQVIEKYFPREFSEKMKEKLSEINQ